MRYGRVFCIWFRLRATSTHGSPSSWRWRSTVPPGDESWQKLPFYAARGVDEVLILDPEKRTVDWLGLEGGEYGPIERSALIDLGPRELFDRIDWP
jgi:hypothetical protein